MAVSKFKTFIAGEILLASDLNSSFDQVFNNGEDLGFPRTKDADFNGNALILDTDSDSEIVATLDDIVGLKLRGVSDIFKWDGATPAAVLANGLTFLAAKATIGPSILAQGTDTNIDINITPKGAGVVTIANLAVQLGADLDANGFDINFDTNTGINGRNGDNITILDFGFPEVSTARVDIRINRFTNTTGGYRTIWHQGNGTANSQHDLADETRNSFACNLGGNFGFGLTNPAEKVDVVGNIGVSGTVDGRNVAADGTTLDTAYQQGKETIFLPVASMTPTVSNGSSALVSFETTAGRPDLIVLDFDQTADEHAQFQIAFPKKWDEGTVTFQYFWTQSVGAVTTGVAFALQAVAVSDNQTIDVAYGTPVVVTDDAQGAVEELLVSAESAAITIAGTPADDDMVYFRIFRDVSNANDDLAGDARLIGIKVFFTSNANDDT